MHSTAAIAIAPIAIRYANHDARQWLWPGRLIDQQLHRALPQAFAVFSNLIRRYQPQRLLVPAYEGGHPADVRGRRIAVDDRAVAAMNAADEPPLRPAARSA
jgi:hypothetical protein